MEKKRDSFRSRWGFILACIGSAVGMGNIWMFPSRVSMYGGGSFLIPYFIFVILIAFTGVIGEMSFGRATGSGPVGAFGAACATRYPKNGAKVGKALGLIPTLGSLALAVGYTVVMGWILRYMIGTFTGATLAASSMDEFGAAFGTMASSFGNNIWQVAALLIALAILLFGIGKGIERVNKVLMPLLFFMFVGLGVYVAFQPGAKLGYQEIFRVDPAALADPMTWVYALGQAFFSLSVAGNGTLIYGSYLSKEENVPKCARSVAFFDTLAALLAAFVIIPAMAVGTAGTAEGSLVSQSGPGLMFISLPNLFKGMPGGEIVAIVFFIAVFFAGITSLINLYEAPIATLQETFGIKRIPAACIVGSIGMVVSICIQGIVSDWMDVVSIFICPLGAGLAAFMFFWVAGKSFVEKAVNEGADKPIGKWFYPLAKYGFCGLCILVLIVGAVCGGIG